MSAQTLLDLKMGIRGLMTYCVSHSGKSGREVDLVQVVKQRKDEGLAGSSGTTCLAIDFYAFACSLLPSSERLLVECQAGKDHALMHEYVTFLGGEPHYYNLWIVRLVANLRQLGIELVFFVDGARGAHASEFKRKLDTLREREDKLVKCHANIKCFCTSGGQLEGGVWSGMRIVRNQLERTALRLGVHWVQCLGEADEEIARYAQTHKEVFAIVSPDSDFLIMRDCQVILPGLVDWLSLILCDEDDLPESIVVPVFSPASIATSLGLPESALPSLAALAGNDITRPLMESYNVIQLLNVYEKRADSVIEGLSQVLATVDGCDVRHLPVVAELMQSDKKLAQAIDECYKFYSLSCEDTDFVWSVSTKNCHPVPESFLSFLTKNVKNGMLPPSSIAIACTGVYWHELYIEDRCLGQPLIPKLTRSLRCFLYGALRQKEVKEYGVQEKGFVVEVVHLDEIHLTIPCVDTSSQLSIHDRVAWYWKILLYELQPDMKLNERIQQKLSRLESFGMTPDEKDHQYVEWLLLTGMMCYLFTLNANMKSKAAKRCRLSRSEADSLFAMQAYCIEQPTPNVVVSSTGRPSMRCVTVGQWYLAAQRYCTRLAALLHLGHFFPEACYLFSGSAWASIYAAVELSENAQSNFAGLPSWVHPVMKERERLLESWKVVHSFVYDTVPAQILPVPGKASEPCVLSKPEPLASLLSKPKALSSTSQVPVSLPVAEHRSRILQLVREERIVCIQGETGCGKSTSVPLYILEDCLSRMSALTGRDSCEQQKINIVVTQPRRVAAIMLARHVAQMRGEPVGQSVGYSVSRDVAVTSTTQITYMTIGYLLQVSDVTCLI